jgi:hypothetical protein
MISEAPSMRRDPLTATGTPALAQMSSSFSKADYIISIDPGQEKASKVTSSPNIMLIIIPKEAAMTP